MKLFHKHDGVLLLLSSIFLMQSFPVTGYPAAQYAMGYNGNTRAKNDITVEGGTNPNGANYYPPSSQNPEASDSFSQRSSQLETTAVQSGSSATQLVGQYLPDPSNYPNMYGTKTPSHLGSNNPESNLNPNYFPTDNNPHDQPGFNHNAQPGYSPNYQQKASGLLDLSLNPAVSGTNPNYPPNQSHLLGLNAGVLNGNYPQQPNPNYSANGNPIYLTNPPGLVDVKSGLLGLNVGVLNGNYPQQPNPNYSANGNYPQQPNPNYSANGNPNYLTNPQGLVDVKSGLLGLNVGVQQPVDIKQPTYNNYQENGYPNYPPNSKNLVSIKSETLGVNSEVQQPQIDVKANVLGENSDGSNTSYTQ